jgi:hypothetical protein
MDHTTTATWQETATETLDRLAAAATRHIEMSAYSDTTPPGVASKVLFRFERPNMELAVSGHEGVHQIVPLVGPWAVAAGVRSIAWYSDTYLYRPEIPGGAKRADTARTALAGAGYQSVQEAFGAGDPSATEAVFCGLMTSADPGPVQIRNLPYRRSERAERIVWGESENLTVDDMTGCVVDAIRGCLAESAVVGTTLSDPLSSQHTAGFMRRALAVVVAALSPAIQFVLTIDHSDPIAAEWATEYLEITR